MEPIVYTMQAHGCDTDSELEVPPGCVYVTFAECGKNSNVTSIDKRVFELFESNSPLLKDPVNNKDEIEAYINQDNIKMGWSIRHIHVHHAAGDETSRTYHNCFYYPELSWSCNADKENFSPPAELDSSHTHMVFLKSGLYTTGIPLIPKHDLHESIEKRIFMNKSKIKLSHIIEIYGHSLLPTIPSILRNLEMVKEKTITEEDDILHTELEKAYLNALHEDLKQLNPKRRSSEYVTQKELFIYYPGIYYNLSCRSNCYGYESTPKQDLRRKKSFESYEAMTKLSADQGNKHAQFTLGRMYDDSKSFHYLKLAADQGHMIAQFMVGMKYFHGTGVPVDKPAAAHYFKLASDQGHIEAQHNMAVIYFNGYGVPVNKDEAFKYFKLEANQGRPEAQFKIGRVYYYGDGVPLNKEEAFRYWKLAADQGHTEAQTNVAYMYYRGDGVPVNKESAFTYFKLASDRDSMAQYNVGYMCYYGDGVPVNKSEAFRYLKMSALQDNEHAKNLLLHLDEDEGYFSAGKRKSKKSRKKKKLGRGTKRV
jgi:TPR repeat protein